MKFALLTATLLFLFAPLCLLSQSNKTVFLRVYSYAFSEYKDGEWKNGDFTDIENPGPLVVLSGGTITIHWNTKEVYHLYDAKTDSLGALQIDTYNGIDENGKEFTIMFMIGANGFKQLTIGQKSIGTRRVMMLENE